ncbi:PEP-CTERM sorting domain-containing protein [Botrimarina hoheduenensis]|uniref:Uncharacterized protein n=1 Tax=Botrimarina hoheduenensis TaxID=2528000 RepID=A0A5C5WCJ4_9BACT|nr:PEP-CTERM sorting domain-containing protein [Botrimarina hoheduenensis]TWT47392.1 hypothetical protein Pla111_10060 [Botrimarina hoheduenensis]
MNRFSPLALGFLALGLLLIKPAAALDLERFEFNDANGTTLTTAVNAINPTNLWSYAEQATTPGDDLTGDISTVQAGAYRIVTDSDFAPGIESRYLNIANTSSGRIYYSATLSSWNFGTYDNTNAEQFRLTFLDDDTGTSGSSVTAQAQIRRNPDTGSMEIFGDAIGTAGSFNIDQTVIVPNIQSQPFTLVLALDKDSNSYEIFYKSGTQPSQALGMGGVSRVRNANSIRMATNNMGAENFPPFVLTEQVNVDRIVVSDTNPLTDLITLDVNRVTGAMTLRNTSGASVTGITGVSLFSASESIDLTQLSGFSGTLTAGATQQLDISPAAAPGLWVRSPIEDVRAQLSISGGGVRTLDVNFINNGGVKWATGDLDFDGTIDADDYSILVANAETDLSSLSQAFAYQRGDLNGSGTNDVVDFSLFKAAYEDANGTGSFALLLTAVPEPASGALLAIVLLSTVSTRRRHGTCSMSPAKLNNRPADSFKLGRLGVLSVVAFLLMLVAPQAEAVFFEDFLFNDTAGTPLSALVNSANPGNTWDVDADTTDVVTNGLGQLNASLKANVEFGTNYIDINPGITTGLVYGVMELTWNFQSALDVNENEEIRLSFINADPRSTAVTAEFRITRTDTNVLELNGIAIGTGASNISASVLNGGSLVQTDKFIAVLAADLDNDTYEVLYSNNAGSSFATIGSGVLDPSRGIEAVRLTLNNDLSGDNVLLDRLYLADQLPIIVEPDLLTLRVHPKSGYAAIINDTTTVFDIDYYRVGSGDGSLLPGRWNSLQTRGVDAVDGPDAGSTAGDGIGERWTEAGGSDEDVLSESFLLSSSIVSAGEAIPLGGVVDLTGDEQLITFDYRDAAGGAVFAGNVEVSAGIAGDYNLDGTVDVADYTVWRDNASGLFTAADYTIWVNNFGSTGLASSAVSIPEPLSVLLAACACLSAVRLQRCQD